MCTNHKFKVLKWTIQPSNISVHESVITQRKILPVNQKPSTCKRKLFESEISNTKTGIPSLFNIKIFSREGKFTASMRIEFNFLDIGILRAAVVSKEPKRKMGQKYRQSATRNIKELSELDRIKQELEVLRQQTDKGKPISEMDIMKKEIDDLKNVLGNRYGRGNRGRGRRNFRNNYY
ncbi:unnamed protein product [Mytilus coruscus]|uniref:Uncharacterized protein n=1 Tax=Mytilus coruscus TaxID=42192 RepID=A0A6J8ANK4_MYTCO|nr:unnamed protein product [Mytilus coruscus]